MMIKTGYLISLIVLLGCFPLNVRALQDDLILKRMGVEQGLSNNYVVDITQDNQGCVWIATESGLNKFDGRYFTVYNRNNSQISGNEHNALLSVPQDNTIWIGTQRDGISIFDVGSQTFETLDVYGGLITNDVTDLKMAADGGVWITHYHLGIDHYDRKTKKIECYSTSNVKGFTGRNWTSCDDGKGHLYVGHVNDGLSIIDLKTRTCENFRHSPDDPKSIPSNTVHAILMDSAERMWVGTENGLSLFNPVTKEFTTFRNQPDNPRSLLSNQVYDIRQTRDGNIWVCTNMGGVSILDLRQNSFIRPEQVQFRNLVVTNDIHGLSSPNARCLFEDSFGNIWIGNYRGGVDVISHLQPLFKTLPYQMKRYGEYTNKQVWGINVDSDGHLWLGGENEVAVFDKGKMKDLLRPQAVKNTHVNVIYTDRSGDLWMGMYLDGVTVYRHKTGRMERISSGYPNLDVRCFYEDTDGKMWIGTESGIYSYENGQLGCEDSINNQLSDNMVHSILRDKQGKLWIGTFGKGIQILNRHNNLVYSLTTDNGMASNAVSHLAMNSRGEIWAATRNGLVFFERTDNPNGFRIFSEKDGIENSYVRAIQEDGKGNIWFSTNNGISCYEKATGMFRNYNYHDGVPRGDFMDGSVCRTADGTIYFGSQNGVCYFHPATLDNGDKVAPVVFTECRSMTGDLRPEYAEVMVPIVKNKIKLSYRNNNLRIGFNVTDFSQAGQVEYIYQMEGLNDSWYNTHGENQVTFRNLPYGNYTFKVNARMRNQAWTDENIASLTLVIEPPLWLAWYAKLFYVAVACLILFFILRFYKHKLDLENKLSLEHQQLENGEKLNAERLRFYTNITHELRTPLTLIIGPLEDLLSDKSLSQKHAERIGIIHSNANRLLALINQILEFRKTETQNRKLLIEKANLGKLVREIGLGFKELNQNSRVDIEVKIETEETELYFDPEIVRIILNNLMSNAMKYTPEGVITLSLDKREEAGQNYTEIKVKDTGFGIDPESIPHIFDRYYQAEGKHQASGTGIGLALVKSLADLHEAKIMVESELNEGSCFTLSLLTDNTYPHAQHKQEVSSSAKTSVAETAVKDSLAEGEDARPVLLVVEDNNDIREYIRSSFEDMYEVLTASNGKEGWDIAKVRIPSVIVSDIMMPIMDGIAFCKRVKQDMRTSHIPVILLTAKDSIQDREEGYAVGADSFIAKPFSARLLTRRIENLLAGRRKLAALIAAKTVSSVGSSTQEALKDLGEGNHTLNKLDREFLDKVARIIEENLSMEKIDVGFIADKMCMSHSTLYRKIKCLTDMSVNEFVRKVKLKKSVDLLLGGEYSIAEISDLAGFSSVAYFRQCFKDEYGMAPSEYLKQKSRG